MKLDLTQGDYKLVNLNETFIDSNIGNKTKIYESFGHPGRFWFVEVKMCFGKAKLRFADSDFDKIDSKQFSKFKTVND